MENRLVEFYVGRGVDHAGRSLDTILGMSDSELEGLHDYIQWLFPMDVPSSVNPYAPVADQETQRAFRRDRKLRVNLCRSCRRMLQFYRLSCGAQQQPCAAIQTTPTFASRPVNWLTPDNHNHLRLTRVLTSLRLLGLSECSSRLLQCLEDIASRYPERVTDRTRTFWSESQQGELTTT